MTCVLYDYEAINKAMHTLATEIISAIEEAQALTTGIRFTADSYDNTLGFRKASLDEALSKIEQSLQHASVTVKIIADELIDTAEAYVDLICNDQFNSASGK